MARLFTTHSLWKENQSLGYLLNITMIVEVGIKRIHSGCMMLLTVTSLHQLVERSKTCDSKTQACGFDSRAGQPNSWITIVFRMR